MQIKTKANVYTFYDDSYIGRDGDPVKFYRIEVGRPGESVVKLPLNEDCYMNLVANGFSNGNDIPITLDLNQYGNKLAVRCVQVG